MKKLSPPKGRTMLVPLILCSVAAIGAAPPSEASCQLNDDGSACYVSFTISFVGNNCDGTCAKKFPVEQHHYRCGTDCTIVGTCPGCELVDPKKAIHNITVPQDKKRTCAVTGHWNFTTGTGNPPSPDKVISCFFTTYCPIDGDQAPIFDGATEGTTEDC